MAVKVEKVQYGAWGNCIRVSNGSIELYATVDIGPRIIRFSCIGKDNMFLEDKQDVLNCDVSEYGWFESGTWHIYGGHRLWLSPEGMPGSYYTDNHPVEYEITDSGVILKQRKQEYLNVRLSMEVSMSADSDSVKVIHKIINEGGYEIEIAPWALSVMAPGGKEVVPQTKTDTGLLGNRILALWPYSNMADSRVYWGDKYITLQQDKNAAGPFKFGSTNEPGYAAYFLNECLFIKKYTHLAGSNYPDFGVSFETYTNAHMLEIETLGALVKLATGQSTEHIEQWSLFGGVKAPSNNENEIEETLKKYL